MAHERWGTRTKSLKMGPVRRFCTWERGLRVAGTWRGAGAEGSELHQLAGGQRELPNVRSSEGGRQNGRTAMFEDAMNENFPGLKIVHGSSDDKHIPSAKQDK